MISKTNTLAEMCELIVDCPHFTPEWTEYGYIVIRNQNIRDGYLDLANPSFTHREDFDRRNRRAKPQAGDIVFTREAPMGEVCLIPAGLECCIGQRQVLLRPGNDVDGKYLFFALRSSFVRHQIFWNEGTGSTVSNVPIPVLEALKIPRLGTQEMAIGSILGALDDKIELNGRMNKTLEATARAIFKDWFVDFGPTRAKQEGHSPYLAPDIWSLFPGRLDDEGKPERWEIKRLDTGFDVRIGRTPPRKETQHFVSSGSGRPWLSIKTMGQLQVFAFRSEEDLTEEAVASFRVPLIKADTVIVSFKLTVGRVAIAAKDIHSNEAIANLVPNTQSSPGPEYTYFFMKAFDYNKLGSTSSIATAVNSDSIRSIKMLFPSAQSVAEFNCVVSPMLQRIKLNCGENHSLAQTRDLLLPKLMSGEIRIKDAETIVGEAT